MTGRLTDEERADLKIVLEAAYQTGQLAAFNAMINDETPRPEIAALKTAILRLTVLGEWKIKPPHKRGAVT